MRRMLNALKQVDAAREESEQTKKADSPKTPQSEAVQESAATQDSATAPADDDRVDGQEQEPVEEIADSASDSAGDATGDSVGKEPATSLRDSATLAFTKPSEASLVSEAEESPEQQVGSRMDGLDELLNQEKDDSADAADDVAAADLADESAAATLPNEQPESRQSPADFGKNYTGAFAAASAFLDQAADDEGLASSETAESQHDVSADSENEIVSYEDRNPFRMNRDSDEEPAQERKEESRDAKSDLLETSSEDPLDIESSSPSKEVTTPADSGNSWLSDLDDDDDNEEIVLGGKLDEPPAEDSNLSKLSSASLTAAEAESNPFRRDSSREALQTPASETLESTEPEPEQQSELEPQPQSELDEVSASGSLGEFSSAEDSHEEVDEFASLRRPFDPAAAASYKPRQFEAEIVARLAKPEISRQYKSVASTLERGLLAGVDRSLAVIGLGDGKTNAEVALSLTYTLAGSQKDQQRPLLLVDGNLEEKELSRGFGLETTKGITEYLNRTSEDLKEYHRTIVPTVALMPAGKLLFTSPSGTHDRAAVWLAACKQNRGLIVVDGGKVGEPAANLWSRVCDAVYLSLDLAEVSPEQARAEVAQLRAQGARVLGVIVVDAAAAKTALA